VGATDPDEPRVLQGQVAVRAAHGRGCASGPLAGRAAGLGGRALGWCQDSFRRACLGPARPRRQLSAAHRLNTAAADNPSVSLSADWWVVAFAQQLVFEQAGAHCDISLPMVTCDACSPLHACIKVDST